MKKNNFKVIKINKNKILFNYEKKVIMVKVILMGNKIFVHLLTKLETVFH